MNAGVDPINEKDFRWIVNYNIPTVGSPPYDEVVRHLIVFARDWAEDRPEQVVGPGSSKHGTDLGPPDGEKTVHEAEAKRHPGQSMMKNPPASEGDNKLTGRIANLVNRFLPLLSRL
jgi:hypothetical protein